MEPSLAVTLIRRSPLHCGQLGKVLNCDAPFPVRLHCYKAVTCLNAEIFPTTVLATAVIPCNESFAVHLQLFLDRITSRVPSTVAPPSSYAHFQSTLGSVVVSCSFFDHTPLRFILAKCSSNTEDSTVYKSPSKQVSTKTQSQQLLLG